MKIEPYLGVLCATAVAVAIGVPVWDHYVRSTATSDCEDAAEQPLRNHARNLRLAHQCLAGLYLLFGAGAFVLYLFSKADWDQDEYSNAGATLVTLQVYGAFFLVLLGLISAVVGGCLTDREHLAKAHSTLQRAETKPEVDAAASSLAEAQGRHLALVMASLVAFGPLILLLALTVAASRKINDIQEILDTIRNPGTSLLSRILKLFGFESKA